MSFYDHQATRKKTNNGRQISKKSFLFLGWERKEIQGSNAGKHYPNVPAEQERERCGRYRGYTEGRGVLLSPAHYLNSWRSPLHKLSPYQDGIQKQQ